ncbi:MAG: BMP family ABC transporter substrate-binding protein [Lachnospiraceae bacterium]|nr:BMP family ABC transporter substrate-binding protein [Lachnospiraceae bacterium]
MKKEMKILIWVLPACLLCILAFFLLHKVSHTDDSTKDHVNVGLILEGDESTPYSNNFIRATDELKLHFGERVSVIPMYNVAFEDTLDAIDKLCSDGCDIIFFNSVEYGEPAKYASTIYPDVEFCQTACDNANEDPYRPNYHTFMGRIYEGRYVAGRVAGLKLTELINEGVIKPEEALIGYVGAFPFNEVISGYTAFFLGVREECPSATMRVKYANTWTSYMLEKNLAKELIDEGCIVISQHSDTVGPAVMCETSEVTHPVFHVGYNQDMIDVAPRTSLIGTRIDWSIYIISAVEAVLENKHIESHVSAHIYGNDSCAGFEEGWVKMLDVNPAVAPQGTQELIADTIEQIKSGSIHVFKGDYLGVNPDDPEDTWDLNTEYIENEKSSAPTFHYILKDVITIEDSVSK